MNPADRPPMVHLKGELSVGPHIRLWCCCGWKWEYEGEHPRQQAELAWRRHLEESGEPAVLP